MIGNGEKREDAATVCRRILDYLLTHSPKYEPACRAAGRNSKWIWSAIKKSADGHPDYMLSWPDPDDEPEQFCDLLIKCRRLWNLRFDASLRHSVEQTELPCIVNGEQQWRKDALLLAKWDNAEDAYRIGGIQDWPYEHDEQGARIPLMVPIPAAAALKVHAARSLLAHGGWNPAEAKTIDAHIGGQVLVVQAHRPAYARDVEQPDTPLRRDLATRLAELRARGPANPVPRDANGLRTIPKITAVPPDPPETEKPDPVPRPGARNATERTGPSKPPPGGISLTTGKHT
jgi:hypothetical protein